MTVPIQWARVKRVPCAIAVPHMDCNDNNVHVVVCGTCAVGPNIVMVYNFLVVCVASQHCLPITDGNRAL